MKYINVALNVPINQVFTYLEPEPTEKKPLNSFPEDPFGYRVEVRFGNRKLFGYVVESFEKLPETCTVPKEKIRHAVRYVDDSPLLTRELHHMAEFMSSYYIAPIGECIATMIPSGKREVEFSILPLEEDEQSFRKKTLSEEQEKAVRGILSNNRSFNYLYGLTGSGKTEVFLSCAEKVLEKGQGVIYLVPEIGLTPQVIKSASERFGKICAVIHSELTPSQKLTEWKRILSREARVVIGARSAIFAPVPELGLIIIDEEHDSSYKSNSSPRYHARQIAMMRARKNRIPLVMGSATPSAESYHAMESGLVERHVLTRRLAGGSIPEIKSIDLTNVQNDGSCISEKLREEIKNTIRDKKQTILFLNRRGFNHFFRCASCGYEMKCKNCSVSMTYHKAENRLRCHYCGYSASPPSQCPECGSLDIGYSGFGTEFIEAEVKAKFPNARTVRIDTDSIRHKGELAEKIDAFKNGEYDILLGTQMVAKGLNFPNLKLVGVVLADTGLHMPDFRASEKTFSLITQVAGRAGRYFPDGKVFVQTYNPYADAIQMSVNGKIDEFYKKELDIRKMLGFPPYTRLLRLVFRSKNQKAAALASTSGANILRKYASSEVEIMGPAECPIALVSNSYRFQILMRGLKIASLQDAAKKLVWGFKCPTDVYIEVDVDPISLL